MVRNLKKRFFNYKTLVLLFAVFLIFLIFNLAKEIINRHHIVEQIAALEDEIVGLEQDNSEIENLISSWSDSNQLEKEARIKLGLQKPGEQAVLIVRPEDKADDFDMMIEEEKEDIPNYKKWLKYFFN